MNYPVIVPTPNKRKITSPGMATVRTKAKKMSNQVENGQNNEEVANEDGKETQYEPESDESESQLSPRTLENRTAVANIPEDSTMIVASMNIRQ